MIYLKRHCESVEVLKQSMYIYVAKTRESLADKKAGVTSVMGNRGTPKAAKDVFLMSMKKLTKVVWKYTFYRSIDPPSWEVHRHFLSYIDDQSHFAVVYLLRKTSEVFEKFKSFQGKTVA
uniref:Uncharacterized protein n=1 Tax=Anopheles minimus TaxID=112268 RepID=A0A182W2T2_9DIPT